MTDTIENSIRYAKLLTFDDYLQTQSPGRKKLMAKLWPMVQAGMPVAIVALDKDDLQVLVNILISMIAAAGDDGVTTDKLVYDPTAILNAALKRAARAADHARQSPRAYAGRRAVVGRDCRKKMWLVPVDPVTISTTSSLFEVNPSAFQADDKQYPSLRERIRAKRRERELAAAGLTDTGADGAGDKGAHVQGDKGGVCPEIDAAMRTNGPARP